MLSGIDPTLLTDVQHQTIALMLYHAGMGNIDSNQSSPGDDIKYYESSKEYSHPWSIEQRAYNYAFYELKEVFGDINEYLSLSPRVALDICKGVRKGSEALVRAKEAKKKNSPKSSEQHDLEAQLHALSRMNLSSG